MVLANLRQRHVDVAGRREVARRPEESVSVGKDVEKSGRRGCVEQFRFPVLLFSCAALVPLTTPLVARRPAAAIAIV